MIPIDPSHPDPVTISNPLHDEASKKRTPTEFDRSRSYAWLVVAMLWLICFFNYADRQALFSVAPLLERDLGLSNLQLGILGSCFAWVYGLSAPVAGFFVDRIRRKTSILAGLQFWSIVCALSAAASSFLPLCLFRAFEGLGESIYYPASTSLISDYHGPKTRSKALGILVTSVYAGTVGGGVWAGTIAAHHGWRMSFIILGVCGSALGAILIFTLREIPRGSADGTSEVRRRDFITMSKTIFSKPTVALLMAAFVCANFVALVLLTWMTVFCFERLHLSLVEAAAIATVYPQIGSILGAFAGGYVADRMYSRTVRGRILTQFLALVAGLPFVVLCGQSSSVTIIAIALFSWGLFKGAYDANIFAAVFDFVEPGGRGTVVGLMNCVGWLLGGGSAPVAIGLLSVHFGLGNAISMSAIGYIAGAAFLLAAMLSLTPNNRPIAIAGRS